MYGIDRHRFWCLQIFCRISDSLRCKSRSVQQLFDTISVRGDMARGKESKITPKLRQICAVSTQLASTPSLGWCHQGSTKT